MTDRIPGRRLLHSPGPTPLPDEVLHAMSVQPMDLGDARVDANIAACEAGLRRLLGSSAADVFFYASNGHGVWEAVVENLAAPGQAVLVPGTGHFSESWAVQTEALGRTVVRTPWREGWPIDVEAVEQALRDDRGHAIQAVFAVHTDTASGVTSDIAAIRRAMAAAGHPALLVADVVASLGAAPFAMDALGLDVAVGASQKGLMCPPGLGIVAVNARGMAAARHNPAPRFYWDWLRRRDPLSYRKFCGTAPQNLMFGLEAALGLIFREGLDAVHARHRLLAGLVQAAVEGWREGGALDFFSRDESCRSVSVTTIAVKGVDVDALRRIARERFQVAVAGGLGPLAGRAFRIGHLGDSNPALILGALGGVEAALLTLGVNVGDGGTRRAVQRLAQS
ncbi:Serine--glyoxylate aminotransferase [Rubrivivax sp. A210]|uniref:pyridoxal-phosphate-dependent aminotransferase family protein n=1 Tax=Rubrivivax sp. A210 TaxID=2772301 RepID=UPI0019192123|nr:aminotransferase class V-fold PLP-dependent enzyme [Rubrivivax sp. A210]CAD5374431.1 Serine--glyoxylate aminotransferase [Rubrivivax sp. A210]